MSYKRQNTTSYRTDVKPAVLHELLKIQKLLLNEHVKLSVIISAIE